ncbi:MAG: PAS domain-containing sensor histidine kinase, partial [Inquilinus sp.]|nr:PAS domain-containing sensor histidine kinase [Inquilinus sp.]
MTHEVLSFPGTDRGAGKAPCARESDRIATAIVGLDGTIQNVNSVFTEILGRSRSELAGASWHDVLHPDECDGEAALFVDLLACAEESVRLTRRLVAQDGAICRGDLKLTALCDGAGEPNGILAEFLPERSPAGSPACKCGDGNHGRRPTTASIAALSRCISQGRQSDHSATPSRQVTRKGADRSHGAAAGARRSGDPTNDLVALMNHEFRTPLNAIIGFAEMLDREMLGSVGDTRYRQYARHIQESGLRLLSFVTDMLDLVSYEHGGVQLHDEVIDPVAPVSASVARAKDDCRSDRVVLSTHVAVDGTRLLADSGAVSRVLSYLIANAID